MSDTDTDTSFEATTKKQDHLTRPHHSYVGAAYTLPVDDAEKKGNLLAPVILKGDDKKELLREVYNDLGLVLDGGKDIECMVSNAEFVDLQVVERNVPLGAWGGKDGKMESENLMEVWRGMGRVVLEAGKNGIRSEKELDGWLWELEREYEEFQGTISWVICFGRKAS
ncbi:hypothetical protein BDQ17DRAFT_1321689 [Cyathus striatus]|nr:hypothetical protein BDQ17DRAFT_1321689 [Cyathus striatus]